MSNQNPREKVLFMVFFPNAPRCGRHALKRVWRCNDGMAATEFAFLAPLLVLMYLGTVEVSRAIDIDRQFTSATAMTSDLVAREEELGDTKAEADATLDGIVQSVQHVMHPYDPDTLKLSIFSVKASTEDASDTKVEWSYSHNGSSAPSKCSSYPLTPGVVAEGESVIVVEASYTFNPLFTDIVPGMSGQITWNDKSIHSPRNSCVDYAGNQCLLDCSGG
jgi:Flp pilus assembly protein TadG